MTVNHGLMIFKTAYPELYASWTNSGLFLYLLFQNHQIIHKDYFKVAIKDFNKILFPKSDIFKEVSELVKVFRNLASNKNLPFLPIQFKEKVPERVALDKTWLKALDVQDKDIPEILDKLYTWLINYFENR